jgi:ABC-type glycerol-3-phosphate transport system permease component
VALSNPVKITPARDPSTLIPGTARAGQGRRTARQAFIHAGLIIWGLVSLYPLVWIVLTSLKYPADLYANPFGLPAHIAWSNYSGAWNDAQMSAYFVNSVVVTIAASVVLLLFSSMCAFALARFDFRLKGILWAYILFGFLVPATLTLIPLAQLTRTLGLYDNRLGLILVYAAGGIPFNTFFLRAYMESIPRELEEAAIMDGSGMWIIYWRMILPLSKPALTTMATFSVLYEWSEFIIALILTGSPNGRTLPVGISQIANVFASNETTVAAAMVISLVPALLVFAFLQRYVVQGLTAGALKS